MIKRFLLWIVTNLICLDQWAQVLIRGPKYIFLNGPKPSADMTISDWVGQCANAGIRLGIIAQEDIDFLFMNPNHCQQAIADDAKD